MRSPFWVETVLCLILNRNEDFADFVTSWFRAFAMGSPFFRVEFAVWAYALNRNDVLFLNHIPRSFGMRSPFGSSGVLGTHSVANEGFNW